MSTQNVNLARYARNVECDFFGDFQTLWSYSSTHRLKVHLKGCVSMLANEVLRDELQANEYFGYTKLVAFSRMTLLQGFNPRHQCQWRLEKLPRNLIISGHLLSQLRNCCQQMSKVGEEVKNGFDFFITKLNPTIIADCGKN